MKTAGQAVQKLVPDLIRDAQMQGAQKLRNEAYIEARRCSLPPRKRGKLAAQRSKWTFFNSLLRRWRNRDDKHLLLHGGNTFFPRPDIFEGHDRLPGANCLE